MHLYFKRCTKCVTNFSRCFIFPFFCFCPLLLGYYCWCCCCRWRCRCRWCCRFLYCRCRCCCYYASRRRMRHRLPSVCLWLTPHFSRLCWLFEVIKMEIAFADGEWTMRTTSVPRPLPQLNALITLFSCCRCWVCCLQCAWRLHSSCRNCWHCNILA